MIQGVEVKRLTRGAADHGALAAIVDRGVTVSAALAQSSVALRGPDEDHGRGWPRQRADGATWARRLSDGPLRDVREGPPTKCERTARPIGGDGRRVGAPSEPDDLFDPAGHPISFGSPGIPDPWRIGSR